MKQNREEDDAFYHDLNLDYQNPNHLMTMKLDLVTSKVKAGERLLDVGSGTGEAVVRLRNKFNRLVALDYNLNSMKFLKSKLGIESKVLILKGDACHLSFKNDYFDCCIMLDVLEHLSSPEKALIEANRCLKEAGQLIISVPNWFDLIITKILRLNPYHKVVHTPRGWIQLIKACDFTVHSYRAVRIPFIKADGIAKRMPYIGMCIIIFAQRRG